MAFFVRSKLVEWLRPHLPEEIAAELADRAPSVKYFDYDWSLNDR